MWIHSCWSWAGWFFALGCGLSLNCCALSRTADEARIAGGVGISGLASELVGVDAHFEVALRKGRAYETSCDCVDTGDIRVPL